VFQDTVNNIHQPPHNADESLLLRLAFRHLAVEVFEKPRIARRFRSPVNEKLPDGQRHEDVVQGAVALRALVVAPLAAGTGEDGGNAGVPHQLVGCLESCNVPNPDGEFRCPDHVDAVIASTNV